MRRPSKYYYNAARTAAEVKEELVLVVTDFTN